MQEKQHVPFGFVQSALPWFVAAGALITYLVTLVPWLSLSNIAFVAKVTALDGTPPLSAPLFFLLTYPIRVLPDSVQPWCLNAFAAVCAALTLALLTRSVALLPHDRTHDQRLRERSDYSYLSIPLAWLPPLFAALVCGLQLTFWEHSISATGESLNLLLFAYVIRCLLELRIDGNEAWLKRFALVYGLGVANNWAMIGFLPCFVVALVWIRGFSLFQFRSFLAILLSGAAGLLLYFFLPLLWAFADGTDIGFWEAMRAHLGNQKSFLLGGGLRSRAIILSLTSVLPVLIMGIRWPSSFGDTSAAGTMLTNAMFRIIHLLFFGVCLWVAFDQKFSPRALGKGIPFLTFYYLGALSVGYFSGYLLLVFTDPKTKPNRRRSPGNPILNSAVVGMVLLAFIGVPAGLIAKNGGTVWNEKEPLFERFAESAYKALPKEGAFVLSDDFYGSDLLILQAYLNKIGARDQHVLLHTRSLTNPEYHQRLAKRFPGRFPDILKGEAVGDSIEDPVLLNLMLTISASNRVYYLHPSFGFYFERFYSRPHGIVHELSLYNTNQFLPGPLSDQELEVNQRFWSEMQPAVKAVQDLTKADVADARFLSRFYSRSLNDWGVTLQRHQKPEQATPWFEEAFSMNTNNRPASVNIEYNRFLRNPQTSAPPVPRTTEERFGIYRDWETLLGVNGPFDHPDYLLQLGEILSQQSLYRQAAINLDRVVTLEATNLLARFLYATNYLQAGLPDRALQVAKNIRAPGQFQLTPDFQVGLLRLEAAAHFSKSDYPEVEKILLDGAAKLTNRIEVLDALVMFYGQTQQYTNALHTIDRILKISPNNPKALINQATLHFNHQDFQKALGSLDLVLGKDTGNLAALMYKVFILIETKDFPNALTEVERVLAIAPDKPEALLYKGVVLIETKEYDKAVEPLDKALELQPNNFNALQNRAIANLQRGNLEAAQEDYIKLRGMQPNYFVAYYGLGEIAFKRNQTADAIEYYEFYLRYSQHLDTPELRAERELVSTRLAQLKGK